VKLVQVYNGEKTEYFAHRAILCNSSTYFKKALTGKFRVGYPHDLSGCQIRHRGKECLEDKMGMYGDDPRVFETMLKFIYTSFYNTKGIQQIAAGDETKEMLFIVRIGHLADKYDVQRLLIPATKHLNEKASLFVYALLGIKQLVAVVQAHYDGCRLSGFVIGKCIVEAVNSYNRNLKTYDSRKELIRK
jgi:hypothetical protein